MTIENAPSPVLLQYAGDVETPRWKPLWRLGFLYLFIANAALTFVMGYVLVFSKDRLIRSPALPPSVNAGAFLLESPLVMTAVVLLNWLGIAAIAQISRGRRAKRWLLVYAMAQLAMVLVPIGAGLYLVTMSPLTVTWGNQAEYYEWRQERVWMTAGTFCLLGYPALFLLVCAAWHGVKRAARAVWSG
jgi:hypothetical protein